MLEFKIECEIDSLEMYFNSHIENIDRAVETTMEYIRKKRILINSFDLNVVVRELLSNAVIHGNQSNPGKMVTFKLITDADLLVLVVKDEGDGFNPEHVAERINDLIPHGMGLNIIKSLGFRLNYIKNEHSVYAEKDLNVDILTN